MTNRLVFGALALISVGWAQPLPREGEWAKPFSTRENSIELDQLLAKIRANAKLPVRVDGTVENRRVTFAVKDRPTWEVLERLAEGMDMIWTLDDETQWRMTRVSRFRTREESFLTRRRNHHRTQFEAMLEQPKLEFKDFGVEVKPNQPVDPAAVGKNLQLLAKAVLAPLAPAATRTENAQVFGQSQLEALGLVKPQGPLDANTAPNIVFARAEFDSLLPLARFEFSQNLGGVRSEGTMDWKFTESTAKDVRPSQWDQPGEIAKWQAKPVPFKGTARQLDSDILLQLADAWDVPVVAEDIRSRDLIPMLKGGKPGETALIEKSGWLMARNPNVTWVREVLLPKAPVEALESATKANVLVALGALVRGARPVQWSAWELGHTGMRLETEMSDRQLVRTMLLILSCLSNGDLQTLNRTGRIDLSRNPQAQGALSALTLRSPVAYSNAFRYLIEPADEKNRPEIRATVSEFAETIQVILTLQSGNRRTEAKFNLIGIGKPAA